MEIIRAPGTNHDFGAPADMQDGSCDALPVVIHKNEHGTWAQSIWQPSLEERAALAEGHPLVLNIRISGEPGVPPGHPVVALGVMANLSELV